MNGILQGPRPYLDIFRDDDATCKPDALFVIASLEIVINDGTTTGIILRLNSYPKESGAEGYWAPPNAQHEVKFDVKPSGTRAVKEAFEYWENKSGNLAKVRASVKSMAQSFGLRDFEIDRIRDQDPLMEYKPSINDPDNPRAYYTIRYRLELPPGASGTHNLVDPEGRYGFVVLPLTDNMDDVTHLAKDPNGTGEDCRFFLGKPTMSGLNRLLERPNAIARFGKSAISVTGLPSSRAERGLIAVADVSGYGTVLQEDFISALIPPEELRTHYRRSVLSTLESMLVSLGTTQVQSAGDGFVAGYPSPAVNDRENLIRLAENWRRCAEKIEDQINGQLEKAEMKKPPSVGSRMALSVGTYDWGRINGISSFYPAFQGGVVVSTARLEQGLNAAVNQLQVAMTDGRIIPLTKRGHYLALSSDLVKEVGGHVDLPGWLRHGECVLESKGVKDNAAELYEWIPPARARSAQ